MVWQAPKTAEQYAQEILQEIRGDAEENYPGIRACRSLSDLHGVLDANEYFIDAQVPWVPNMFDRSTPDEIAQSDFLFEVETLVDRYLQEGRHLRP